MSYPPLPHEAILSSCSTPATSDQYRAANIDYSYLPVAQEITSGLHHLRGTLSSANNCIRLTPTVFDSAAFFETREKRCPQIFLIYLNP